MNNAPAVFDFGRFKLESYNSIPVNLNSRIYDLRIEDKTWVYMERKFE